MVIETFGYRNVWLSKSLVFETHKPGCQCFDKRTFGYRGTTVQWQEQKQHQQQRALQQQQQQINKDNGNGNGQKNYKNDNLHRNNNNEMRKATTKIMTTTMATARTIIMAATIKTIKDFDKDNGNVK